MYWNNLKDKLIEEVQEFNESETAEELADIFEVIDAICDYKKFDKQEIIKLQQAKAAKRGKFEERIILDES